MKKLYSILFILAIFALGSCEDEIVSEFAMGNTHFAFGQETVDFGVEIGGQSTSDIEIYSAFTTSSDRTLDISVVAAETTLDPASYSVPATVTIPANSNVGKISITIQDLNLNPAGDKLVIKFPENTGVYSGDSVTLNVSQLCPNNGIKVKLNLTFDSWPEEASWTIVDSNNNLVWEGSPNHTPYAGAYSGMSGTLSLEECFAAGTYTLNVKDDYADGGTAYEVFSNGVSVGSIGAADYGASGTLSFTIN